LHVYIASFNTAPSTELCIRSLLRYAGLPLQLTVGDSSTRDGSRAMLERFERKGLLRLEVAPQGRAHADWLDGWVITCPDRYALFVDSDMEFLQYGAV